MKKTIILSVAAFALMLSACNSSSNKSEQKDSTTNQSSEAKQSFGLDTTKLAAGETFYQCEMHHQINSDKMGQCPECEMDLTELKKK